MTVYVNQYTVSRHYGGPEEGGWWYDTGQFVESWPCATEELAFALMQQLATTVEPNRCTRYSVLGGADTVFYVEDEPGADWPEEVPHYE